MSHSYNGTTGLGESSADVIGTKRVYEVWKGSNVFCLGGRLIFGPDVRSLFLTLFLIIAPIVVFCVFVGRHLMKDFSPSGVAIVVVTVAHTSLVLTLLLMASARDPGIVPRNAHPPEPEDESSSSSDYSGAMTPRLRLPRTKDVIVNGVVVKTKYCDTCMLYRPPRCSHCSICNNCVERFDHHCPWVGQCIGRRNYPYFFGFVSSTTLLCFFIIAMCALRIKNLMDGDPPLTVWRALKKSPASGFLMAYAFLATWFVGGLTGFHIYLMSTNQTTYENFRYRYDKRINPFDQGVLKNVWDILFSRVPPSKVNFRAAVTPDIAGLSSLNYRQKANDNMAVMGLKNEKSKGDIEMADNSSWMVKPTKDLENNHLFLDKAKQSFEESRNGFEDAFPEDFSKSFSQAQHRTRIDAHTRHGHQSEKQDLGGSALHGENQ
ncbi:hypothetical protein KP509_31G051500 [Ceratopteris richardii]|uniref:S-acyltransferase n=1 Tax=Ceratopteris richardii TaxID=49495 RepID=A0A8T2QZ67_CERRI|nr:hypothetical protein KP509_31G051500 [Ceratopteris richardii]